MTGGQGQRVVITGGAGFVGLHIAEELAAAGWDVLALDVAPPDAVARTVAARADGAIAFGQVDVRDAAALTRAVAAAGADALVHAAAITTATSRESRAMLEVNMIATQVLLDALAAGHARRLVVITSAGALTSPHADGTLDENHPPTLDGPYAISKHAAERLVDHARREDGADAVALRLPAVYGPYERPTGNRTRMSSVYDAVHLARAGKPIVAAHPGVVRDWTHSADIGLGVRLSLEADTLPHSLYHLGVGRAWTLRETFDAVAAAVPGAVVHWVDDPAEATLVFSALNARAALGIDRAHAELGYEPRFDIMSGVRDYVAALDGLPEDALI